MASAFYRCNDVRSTSVSLPKPSSPHTPTMVSITSNPSYCLSLQAEVHAHLMKAIPIRPPLDVFEPMHHLVFAAPATKAPALCLAACELVGGLREEAMAAASALHLMNSAAYVHEHLSLTDRPVEKPVIPHSYGPNIELLTGDGIVPFGFELLARSLDPAKNNSDRVLRVIVEVARAFGSQGVIDGIHEGKMTTTRGVGSDNRELGDDELAEHVCRRKEGVIHACAGACGAILGGGGEEEIERLRTFGHYVGMVKGLVGMNEKGILVNVEKYRDLALKELKDFNGREVEAISSLLEHSDLCIALSKRDSWRKN